jgi:cyclic-di-GMP-binding protein
MPSFDIVSEVDSMEVQNAVNQAKKELANRFDFKGSNAEIALEKDEIKLSANDQFKLTALLEIMIGKLAKRGVDLKSVDRGEPDISPLGHARQVLKIKQGLESDVAKQITGFIREGKFKVTTQIQDQQVRVTGKSRDELQGVIAAVRGKDFPAALSFKNFRDAFDPRGWSGCVMGGQLFAVQPAGPVAVPPACAPSPSAKLLSNPRGRATQVQHGNDLGFFSRLAVVDAEGEAL